MGNAHEELANSAGFEGKQKKGQYGFNRTALNTEVRSVIQRQSVGSR
jgi:hypothetical protein